MTKSIQVVFPDGCFVRKYFHNRFKTLNLLLVSANERVANLLTVNFSLLIEAPILLPMHLEDELEKLLQICRSSPSITLRQLFSETSPEDQALVTFFLSLPFLLPIPLPGLSIPFGIVIFVIGLRMFLGKGFWLPQSISERPLSSQVALKVFTALAPLVKRFSKWVKPRGRFFSKHPGNKRLSFFLICCCGFLLLLPLPPGTNAPPGFTAAALSLGVLEEDSLYLVIGYVCFFLIFLLFLALAFWGYPQVIRWFGY